MRPRAAHSGTPGIVSTLEVIQRQFGRPVTGIPRCDPDYSPSVEVLSHVRRTSLRRACSFIPVGTSHICSAGLAAAPGGSRAIRKLDRGDQVGGKRPTRRTAFPESPEVLVLYRKRAGRACSEIGDTPPGALPIQRLEGSFFWQGNCLYGY